ncbi:MAG: cytochrome C [Proteobacteria bacterium]|nr:cytochrome C [Pseudomonadota bacterium]MBU1738890.1 cytochrome C [Pseudomonadota bacterium]
MKSPFPLFSFFMGIFLIATAAFALAKEPLPREHPEKLPRGNPVCTDCHDAANDSISFKRFNHTLYFTENHKFEANQGSEVCSMCHRESFCADCHAADVELKPSIRNQSDTYRRTPHRGDYLARHRIDGRIDPTSCFRCHGNPKAAERCASCHG